MNSTTVDAIMAPLVETGRFKSIEDAVQKLAKDYIWQQITYCQQVIRKMEHKYGMDFSRFTEYLRERARSLQSIELSPQQKKDLNRVIMIEEDDWIEWKADYEMLDSWLGLKK
ncbi:hypothetical protein KKE26_02345 [bacterium]|nr:hypothetical protein [bacterium]MBU1753013.1 hypothetical protein [bacterium]